MEIVDQLILFWVFGTLFLFTQIDYIIHKPWHINNLCTDNNPLVQEITFFDQENFLKIALPPF